MELKNIYPFNIVHKINPDLITVISSDNVLSIISELSDNDQLFLSMRFEKNKSLSDIARYFNYSRQNASLTETKLLERISKQLEMKGRFVPQEQYEILKHKYITLEHKLKTIKYLNDEQRNLIESDLLHQDISIDKLNLSFRTYEALLANGLDTINKISSKSIEELLSLKNFGKQSLNELLRELSKYGVVLKYKEE